MPELPEVETIRRGIGPHIEGKFITNVIIRDRRLRWPISPGLKNKLCGNKIDRINRRGKYLLLNMRDGTLLIHLGMSGRLRILPGPLPPGKHDHLDIVFADQQIMRYTDPRRFGSILWATGDPLAHRLLAGLGPEPLERSFDGKYLFNISRNKKLPVKSLVMDSHIVVGVGNIYANEALFLAGINPFGPANDLSRDNSMALVGAIKKVLKGAIKAGGTTLRDFVSATGAPGYFQQKLFVYGRGGQPCVVCGATLLEERLGQRTTVYCPACQKQ